jgi:hypothetical protein
MKKEKKALKENLNSILERLSIEICEGLSRVWGIIKTNKLEPHRVTNEGNLEAFSPTRIYMKLWDAMCKFVCENVDDPMIIRYLHEIYYCFDLVNFNQQQYKEGFESGKNIALDKIDIIACDLRKYLAILGIDKDSSKFCFLLEYLEPLEKNMSQILNTILPKIPEEDLKNNLIKTAQIIEELVELLKPSCE